MSDEVLSQDEVESLLNAMGTPEGESPAPVAAAPTARSQPAVTPYDFKRPERVGKEQMRALQSLHEGLGRNLGASLSGLLRSIVEVKLTSVDQLTYNEFIFSLENPTCFNLLKAEPLDGNLILDLNPSILYPIIDRLLGGGKQSAAPARRPLTEIELRLVSRITNLFLSELRRSWEKLQVLELSVERVESNPQLVQVVPPNEVVVQITFEISIGDSRGFMNLCIPFNSIERLSGRLAANTWVSYGKVDSNEKTKSQVTRRLDEALVDLTVTLAETKITTGDLISLRVGDIITTEKDKHLPLVVSVEGVPKYHAAPGAYKGRKAFQIDEPIVAPSD